MDRHWPPTPWQDCASQLELVPAGYARQTAYVLVSYLAAG